MKNCVINIPVRPEGTNIELRWGAHCDILKWVFRMGVRGHRGNFKNLDTFYYHLVDFGTLVGEFFSLRFSLHEMNFFNIIIFEFHKQTMHTKH